MTFFDIWTHKEVQRTGFGCVFKKFNLPSCDLVVSYFVNFVNSEEIDK